MFTFVEKADLRARMGPNGTFAGNYQRFTIDVFEDGKKIRSGVEIPTARRVYGYSGQAPYIPFQCL